MKRSDDVSPVLADSLEKPAMPFEEAKEIADEWKSLKLDQEDPTHILTQFVKFPEAAIVFIGAQKNISNIKRLIKRLEKEVDEREVTLSQGEMVAIRNMLDLLKKVHAANFSKKSPVEQEKDWNEAGILFWGLFDKNADVLKRLAVSESSTESIYDLIKGAAAKPDECNNIFAGKIIPYLEVFAYASTPPRLQLLKFLLGDEEV
jgi:hypothetical protein